MTTQFFEYRLSYGSENVFFCFARNIGDAICQLNQFYGDDFKVNIITKAKVSIPEKGWQLVDITVKNLFN